MPSPPNSWHGPRSWVSWWTETTRGCCCRSSPSPWVRTGGQAGQARSGGAVHQQGARGLLQSNMTPPPCPAGDRPTIFIEIIHRVGCLREQKPQDQVRSNMGIRRVGVTTKALVQAEARPSAGLTKNKPWSSGMCTGREKAL